jgi:peptidoglycan/LPS O-acetylase OafA/YrhL
METTTTERVGLQGYQHKPKSKKIKLVAPKRATPHSDGLLMWCHAFVGVVVVLSAVLNSMANASGQTDTTLRLMAYGMGSLIPVLVLMLFRIAGLLARRKRMHAAYAVAVIGACLLLLSVYHCAHSITVLTGGGWWLSVPMAVAIDCGLATCEWVSVTESK